MYSGNLNSRTLPVTATWVHNRDQQPTVSHPPPPRRPLPNVGKRTELARYNTAAGERVLYGQRIDGVVRFLPGKRDVLVMSSRPCEDDTCRPREAVLQAARTDEARHGRLNRGGAMREPRVEEGS
jgi:hypothetical protein